MGESIAPAARLPLVEVVPVVWVVAVAHRFGDDNPQATAMRLDPILLLGGPPKLVEKIGRRDLDRDRASVLPSDLDRPPPVGVGKAAFQQPRGGGPMLRRLSSPDDLRQGGLGHDPLGFLYVVPELSVRPFSGGEASSGFGLHDGGSSGVEEAVGRRGRPSGCLACQFPRCSEACRLEEGVSAVCGEQGRASGHAASLLARFRSR